MWQGSASPKSPLSVRLPLCRWTARSLYDQAMLIEKEGGVRNTQKSQGDRAGQEARARREESTHAPVSLANAAVTMRAMCRQTRPRALRLASKRLVRCCPRCRLTPRPRSLARYSDQNARQQPESLNRARRTTRSHSNLGDPTPHDVLWGHGDPEFSSSSIGYSSTMEA